MESNKEDYKPCVACTHHEPDSSLSDTPRHCWDCLGTTTRIYFEPREPKEEQMTPNKYAELHFAIDDEEQDETYSPLDSQVGGDHYTKLKIQPMEYSMANKLDPCQHTIIKYVTRCRDKGTPIEDLDKASHCIDLLKEFILNERYQ